jgi:hypothetical protein
VGFFRLGYEQSLEIRGKNEGKTKKTLKKPLTVCRCRNKLLLGGG